VETLESCASRWLASRENRRYARREPKAILHLLQGQLSLGNPAKSLGRKGSGTRGEPTSVDNSAGITASLQGRYASALFDLAQEKGAVSAVEADLATLGAAIAGSGDLADLIRNPQISRDDAARAVDGVAALLGLGDLTKNFLGVVAGNRRLAALPDIIAAFAAIAAAARGEVSADVISAHPLDEAQITALTAKLAAREGKSVKINASVDPELLGGLVIRIGSQQIDSSIRTRLHSLAQAMKG
jgi:F-type H+-transporting ATPase subunit delta